MSIYTKITSLYYVAMLIILILLTGNPFLITTKFTINIKELYFNATSKRVKSK